MTIGQKIKLARERRGLSQRALGEKSNTSCGFISGAENGNNGTNHGTETLRGVAEALGVPFTWLLNIPGAPEPIWDATATIEARSMTVAAKLPRKHRKSDK